jgi:hypothetical protein
MEDELSGSRVDRQRRNGDDRAEEDRQHERQQRCEYALQLPVSRVTKSVGELNHARARLSNGQRRGRRITSFPARTATGLARRIHS